jgi:hypothetical protein
MMIRNGNLIPKFMHGADGAGLEKKRSNDVDGIVTIIPVMKVVVTFTPRISKLKDLESSSLIRLM